MNTKLSIMLLTLAGFFVLGFSGSAIAKPVAVEVVNTPDVNVVNLPAVQEVTGSVEVTNAPAVKEPYRAFDTSGSGNEQVYFEAVETGKRLYIEYVSLRATTNLDSTVFCWISAYDTVTHETNARHWIEATKIDPPDSSRDQFIASTPVTLNIEAGEKPEVGCYIDPIHDYQVSASVAGYMIDVP